MLTRFPSDWRAVRLRNGTDCAWEAVVASGLAVSIQVKDESSTARKRASELPKPMTKRQSAELRAHTIVFTRSVSQSLRQRGSERCGPEWREAAKGTEGREWSGCGQNASAREQSRESSSAAAAEVTASAAAKLLRHTHTCSLLLCW